MAADSPFRLEKVERTLEQHDVSPMRIDNSPSTYPPEDSETSSETPSETLNPGRLFIRTKYSPLRSLSQTESRNLAPTGPADPKKITPRGLRSISETNIMLEYPNLANRANIPVVNVVDSPYNKENVPPTHLPENLDDQEVGGKVSGLSSKLISLSLGVEKLSSVKNQFQSNSLCLSTDSIFGPSRLTCDKTRLQVEAENIRRITSVTSGKSKLEILTKTSQPELNCLCTDTVAKLVLGEYNHLYDKIIIVDCRFEYEFFGGHIKGALNFPKEDDVDQYFIKDKSYQSLGEKLCIVFHCEFSSHRGPKSYKRVRSNDRKLNEPNYPDLFYPEMYLLEGGYKQFFKDYPSLCDPQGYVEMKDPCFIPQMKIGLQSRGRSKSQRRFFTQSCSNILELENCIDNDSDEESKSIRAATSRHVIKTIRERN